MVADVPALLCLAWMTSGSWFLSRVVRFVPRRTPSVLCFGFLGVTLLTYASGGTTPVAGAVALAVQGFAILGFTRRILLSGIIATDSGLDLAEP